ncbi:MAG: DUF2723 domain-containing protein [Spirochaetota bacterium]|nr:DUF2723 domain-containing protein [Spirochaetota bacterium]
MLDAACRRFYFLICTKITEKRRTMTTYHIWQQQKTGQTREVRQGFSVVFLYLSPVLAFFAMKIFDFVTGRMNTDAVYVYLQDSLGDAGSRMVFFIAFIVLTILAYLAGGRFSVWREKRLLARGFLKTENKTQSLPELVTRRSIGVVPGAQSAPYRFVRNDFYCAGVAFLVSFGVYLFTMTPELCTGDSGELTTAMYNLGAAHPPGTPLFTMIGKIFIYLPIGSVAYRVNLMAAFFGALTAAFLFLLLFRLLHRGAEESVCMRDRLIALAGSLFFAFSMTMWGEAIVAEKYTLNAFFAPVLLLAALVWQECVFSSLQRGKQSYSEKYLLLIALLLGLAFTNHHLLLGYIPPFVLLFFVVTQFMGEPNVNAACVSKNTANMLLSALICLMSFLLLAVFGERAITLTQILFAVCALCALTAASYLLLYWLKSLTGFSQIPLKFQYTCGAVVAGVGALSALVVLQNAWNVSLLSDEGAARTLAAILAPLITLGATAIVLLNRLPSKGGLPSKEGKPDIRSGLRKEKRLLLWGLGVWTAFLLLVLFEKSVLSVLRLPLFFLPSSWFADTRIRESLDFIGVDWGFTLIALLVYILGATIAVFAYMRVRKGTQIRERFVEMSSILFKGALIILLPMLLYMTLVIRANAIAKIPDPPLSWGETVNASRVINHFLRKQYPKASMYSYNRIPEIANGWMKMHVAQYFPLSSTVGANWKAGEILIALPVFLLMIALGMRALWKRNRLWFWVLLACFVTFNVLLTTMLSPKDTQRDWYFNQAFYVPSHLIVGIWFTFAFYAIADFAGKRFWLKKPKEIAPEGADPEEGAAQ